MVPYGHTFAFVNLNIHAVMYSYYALAIMESTKRHWFMRAVRPYITSSQLLQMFLGTAIAFREVMFPVEGGYYGISDSMKRDSVLALCMYVSYAYLFGDFWVKNYTNSSSVRA